MAFLKEKQHALFAIVGLHHVPKADGGYCCPVFHAREDGIIERKAEQERKAKIRAERMEALKPVKQKLTDFASSLLNIEVPIIGNMEADSILHSAKELLAKVSSFIIEKSETL